MLQTATSTQDQIANKSNERITRKMYSKKIQSKIANQYLSNPCESYIVMEKVRKRG